MASAVNKLSIKIQYPSILKMEISSKIEIETTKNLTEIQDLVFNNFCNTFRDMGLSPFSIQVLGKREQVTLREGELVIDTDQQLQERLQKTRAFQAVFIRD